MGVAESSVKQLVSEGKVNFAEFERAFQSLSTEGGFAFGGMAKASETLSGRFSTLKDNVSLVTAQFGNFFLPVLKDR